MRTSNYFPVMLECFSTHNGPDDADYRRALDTVTVDDLPEHSTERLAAITTDEAGRTFRMRAYTTAVGEMNVWVDVIQTVGPDDDRAKIAVEDGVKLVGCARFSWDGEADTDQDLHRQLAARTRQREAAALTGHP